MIPKVIHYCWFGGKELSPQGKRCMESWKRYCPDYQILEWNEKNYDWKKLPYMREAYEEKKWAFVSDYARLDIVYQHGGVYLDVDVEVLRNFDELLDCPCFLAVESTNMIATGLGFGAQRGNENIRMMMEQYQGIHFKLANHLYDMLPCPHRNTIPFQRLGFLPGNQIQVINGAVIYPVEYFCPLDYKTRKLTITDKTVSIHHFNASWKTMEERAVYERIAEYGKCHNWFQSKLYKNRCEYQLCYDRVTLRFLAEFICNKFRRRRNRKKQGL